MARNNCDDDDGMCTRESLSIFFLFLFTRFVSVIFFLWVTHIISFDTTMSSSSDASLYGMQFFKCLFILSKIRKCIFINVVSTSHSVCLFMEFLPICLFIFLAQLLLSLKKCDGKFFSLELKVDGGGEVVVPLSARSDSLWLFYVWM